MTGLALPAGGHAGQQGQALVLGMVLAGAALIVFLRYFGVGQVVGAKAKHLHALDAAAYSGALIQARALNMLAYVNRAHVGHQLAMAHLVTLGSWAALGGTQARQLGSANPPAHLIGMFFGPEHGAAYLAASRAAGLETMSAASHGQLAQAYAAHDSVLRDVLSVVQNDIVNSVPAARQAAIHAVLSANFQSTTGPAGFDLAVDYDSWPGYLRSYSGHGHLRGVVQEVAGLYGFLAERNATERNPWVVDARCPGLRHQLRRRGDTQLDGQGRWQSTDTLSFHALRSNRWIGCYYREYAMGWGWIPSATSQTIGAPHVDDPPDDFSAQDFWRWVQEATDWDIAMGDANPLANSRASASRQRWQGGGLPAYFDVASNAVAAVGFGLTLRHPGPQGLTVTTQSAAETFFSRPTKRDDHLHEAPNLFHPYWQSRLATHASQAIDAQVRP
ncbi:hypothetical protein H0A64_08570 [Alcaligenaceae bacterium]|nr:hypothetical protein [Alcaligenaceae bacterium]